MDMCPRCNGGICDECSGGELKECECREDSDLDLTRMVEPGFFDD